MKTSKKQISLFTEDKLTLSQEDSPVNHTPQQENEKGRMMKDIYGQRCCDAFRKCNHVGLWAKTFSDLLIGQGDWYSKRCNLIWRLKGTKYNRIYFQLQPKTLRTEEIESGLLLTPSTIDIKPTEERMKKREEYRESIGRKWVAGSLTEQIYHDPKWRGMLPTPRTSDERMHWRTENWKGDDLGSEINHILGTRSHLNPRFVAEMMGFPNKWTEKPFEENSQNSFDAVDFNDFPTSYPIVQEEFQPNNITHSKWRRESIKGYGNAVVPQVVLEIFKAIDKYENLNNENQ